MTNLQTEDLNRLKQLEKLVEIMREITEAHDLEVLLKLILNKSLELVNASRGCISLVDLTTGDQSIMAHCTPSQMFRPLKLGEGVTGKALREETPIRIDDVRSPQWQGIYVPFWQDTQAELAVPILISNARIRDGRKVGWGSKPIGVINVESPTREAFSQADEYILWSLARQAAVMLDKLENERKLTSLSQFEKKIAGLQDWDAIFRIVVEAITTILGYEFVNISLIIPELKRIKSKYVVGLGKREAEEFKRLADHPLDGTDIQADIVRHREIEVPALNDQNMIRYFHSFWSRSAHKSIPPNGRFHRQSCD